MNTQVCNKCTHYDPIAPKTKHGWCAKKSIYPFKEQPGQLFPLNVRRGKPDQLAKPVIVAGNEVQVHCTDFLPKP
jgi:hypothetical protein